MNLDNVQYYNLGAMEVMPGYLGKAMVRVPMEVRHTLNERARFIGMDSVGIEVRFVTDAPNIDLYLSAIDTSISDCGVVRIYKGNFLHDTMSIPYGRSTTYRINAPMAFSNANSQLLDKGGYAPDVWRVVCDRSTMILQGINVFSHEIRSPRSEELPPYNWLAYGSSITNSTLDGYPYFAASKLNVQVQNKGFSGACHIEKQLVDYFIDVCEFDFITCELGVNMREVYTPSEFEERAAYLIKRLVGLGKPALIITTFPNGQSEDYIKVDNDVSRRETLFNHSLIKLVSEANKDYIRLVNGYDILDDTKGLSSDLVHPTTYGHAVMGHNLAIVLKSFLREVGMDV